LTSPTDGETVFSVVLPTATVDLGAEAVGTAVLVDARLARASWDHSSAEGATWQTRRHVVRCFDTLAGVTSDVSSS